MTELRELARKLLADGTVQIVIGYEEGPKCVRPSFARDAAGADRLIFDDRCAHDLAAYLSPRRLPVKRQGRVAVVLKGCDACALAGLVRESQIKREDVVVIGVRCGGVKADPRSPGPLSESNVADRCRGCTVRTPTHVDHIVGPETAGHPGPSSRDARIAEIEAMSQEARWKFWMGHFERCTRCNACRQVCPLCFCERCLQDKTQPQWLESSPHARANLAWHLTRAMHLAGRCVDCGECERACPVDIPLSLLNRKVAQVVAERFDHHPSDDPSVPAPVGTFSKEDAQEFIL